MKIIPYLRLVWATFITINFIVEVNSGVGSGETFLFALRGLVFVTFATYCIVIGLQEIRDKQIIDAWFFEFFGLILELIVFFAGLILIFIFASNRVENWRIGEMVIWQIGLLTLLIVDFRRIWARSKPSR